MSDSSPPITAAAPAPLADDEIHLWFYELDADGAVEARRAAQAFLLRLLSRYLGHDIDAGALRPGAHGKPALATAALSFNLSHSGDAAAVALARGIEVGIDLETMSRPRPHARLARRFFCPSEARALAAVAPQDRETAFLRLWTAKESVLKALGRGLAFGLDRLEFDLTAPTPALRHIAADGGDVAHWHIAPLPLAPPRVGHVAWHGESRRLAFFHEHAAPSTAAGNRYLGQLWAIA